MPFMENPLLVANELFAPPQGFDAQPLLDGLSGVGTLGEAIGLLGLPDREADAHLAEPFSTFVAEMPPSLDAAVLAAVRSALERGLRVQFGWRPAVGWSVDLHERSQGPNGLLRVEFASPEPVE